MDAPFKLGDRVKFSRPCYYGAKSNLNAITRSVIAIYRSRGSHSGWLVDVDGQGFRKNSLCIKGHDSSWFVKVSELNKTEILLEKVYSKMNQGLSNMDIDKSFQRHVSKVDLIQCLRFLKK